MKFRILKNEEGKYETEYLQEGTKFSPHWTPTRVNDNLGGPRQNVFDTPEEAEAGCIEFRKKFGDPRELIREFEL